MNSKIIIDDQYNIGHICTRMQCDRGNAEKLAMRFIFTAGGKADYTFRDIDLQSNKFANVLQGLGFEKGDVFFAFLPKSVHLIFAFLGALKLQVIAGTLFPNFGDEALLDRLGDSRAKGILTKKSLLKKIQKIRSKLPDVKHIIVVDIDEHIDSSILSYKRLMEEAEDEFFANLTAADTPSVLHYTSGSTGKPKGVLHAHRSILSQNNTTLNVLDLDKNDRFWCTAEPGWVTGTSYGIIGPLSAGITQIHFEGGYNAQRWMKLLEEEKINVWYTAPTALRMLMQEDPAVFDGVDLRALRHVFSVGEPLNPEVIHWARNTLGKDVYDTYFQTETGSIMVSNRPGLQIKPGSMGKPVAGIECEVISDEGTVISDSIQGNLCIKSGWPSMFLNYLNNDEAYRGKFRNGHYYTGDRAYRDSDGYFWFVGRNDDVINTAGHLISPFEIESALLEIEEVAEAAAIGAPDDLLFEKVVAFVKLHRQYEYSEELNLKIRLHVTRNVSSIATPQDVVFCDQIPKTKSGKIMRRVLKAQYLNQELGDISTLEEY